MNRQTGSLLLEVMIGVTLLTVGLLGYLTAFSSNFRLTDEVEEYDKARLALENAAETLRSADFETFYTDFQGASLEAPGLESGTGYGNASISVNCYVDERALPGEFGPIVDLDGVAGLTNSNCSAGYKVLPVRLSLNFDVRNRQETMDWYLVLRG